MNRNTLLVILAGCVVAFIFSNTAFARTGGNSDQALPTAVLSDAEEADLLFMREEEKLARDVYILLHAEWGARVFNNISQSEQRHMEAMLGLIDRYGLQDPALDPGIFTNPHLQELYDDLTDRGLESRLEALMVGALIEEVDMEDIAAAMERTRQKDILTVYSNLLNGSKNHLIAFVRNIEAMAGATYTAQWISQTEVDEILGR